ncbi:MAG: GPR endopeptidase [Oscillospiraceae bacterium]|nr:GPR endopeptidase [Oscillospiraceae bacterium]
MLGYRTDLALETVTGLQEKPRITEHHRGKYFQITEIIIPDDTAGRSLGKPAGRYITLESAPLSGFSDQYEQMAMELAGEIRALLPDDNNYNNKYNNNNSILVAGLGNANITPDALGVRVTEKILATRHLQKELQDDDFLKQLRPVSVIAGGVLGQTGIESAEFLQAIAGLVKPAAILAIDALACSDLERLGTTIQIADTGIAPGSGVANHRKALNQENFGVPVIGIGVPTVIGIRSIAENLSENITGDCYQIPESFSGMMVTPRDVDRLISQSAYILACGINLALHPTLKYTDVAGF